MSNSSQQTEYLTISDDNIGDITIDVGYDYASSDTITISGGSGSNQIYIDNSTMYTTPGNISTVTLGPISATDLESFIFNPPEEWSNSFPEWDRIQKMCDIYPGLKIAFEKFKTTYKLVKDDYDNPDTQK